MTRIRGRWISRRWIARPGGGNTAAAALSVALSFAGTLAGAVFVSGPAAAQARLEAHYTATLAGLPIGEGIWAIELQEDRYTATVQGNTLGLIKMFTGGRAASSASGILAGGQFYSTKYVTQIATKSRTDDIAVSYADGDVKEYRVVPPIDDDPERVPITSAEKQGVMDPMTASMLHVPPSSAMTAPEVCKRQVAVFDGRLRYNLKLAFKRMETVAARGYSGPAVVCSVAFFPVGGFIPSRAAIKYLIAMRDAEVWLAPVNGTRVLVPFRVQVPTPLGPGVLEAAQFVAAPLPVKASVTNGKAH